MHRVETNGWNELDHSQKWIAAGDGLRPGMNPVRRWIAAWYGSQLDMDAWQEMDDRIWISGDGSRKTDNNQSPSPLRRYWGYAKLYDSLDHDFDLKLQSYTRMQICRHAMYRRHSSTKYDTEQYFEHYSKMPEETATCPGYNAEYNLESDPDLASVITSHTATMPIPHIMKPYEVNFWRSNDI